MDYHKLCLHSIDATTAILFVLKYFWLIWIWYLALKVIKGYIYYAHVASTSMKYLLFALTKGISSIPLSSSRRAGATTSIQPVPVFFSHIGLYFNRKRAKIQEIYQRLYQHIFLRNEILCVHLSGITFLSWYIFLAFLLCSSFHPGQIFSPFSISVCLQIFSHFSFFTILHRVGRPPRRGLSGPRICTT